MSETKEPSNICPFCDDGYIAKNSDRCQECMDSTCKKCGGETATRLIGDEIVEYCPDCGDYDPE